MRAMTSLGRKTKLIHISFTSYKAERLLLVKCNDKKWFKSFFNWVIFPLTQPPVANQQKKRKKRLNRFQI